MRCEKGGDDERKKRDDAVSAFEGGSLGLQKRRFEL